MTRPPVYLDYAASTPVDPAVAAAMQECLTSAACFGNPHSLAHAFGRGAAERVEEARARVAALIHAAPDDVIWTSGATEADNLALIGAARFRASRGRHIVVSAIEHPAVLEAAAALAREGFAITQVEPDANGIVDPGRVEAALRPDTTLVSVMHVNNEIGVIQDVGAIGEICRAHDAWLHVDAAQSAGRVPIDVDAQQIDLLSLSAHKMYGPKGVGALYLNRATVGRITPLFHGGGQERGLRPGTVATHQVVGMGLAFELARARRADDVSRQTALRDRLWAGIKPLTGVLRNGHSGRRACHILSVSVAGVEGESLHYALQNLAVSAGSACSTDTTEPSPVLRRLGRSDELARATVRFSLGRPTTGEEIEVAVSEFTAAVERLRRIAPSASVALA